jgi:2-phospho-L-lactate guanylyltransferase (CobY/MobA/RfbA family)
MAGLRRLLVHADGARPLVVAAPAMGREGTNALFLRPPSDFTLRVGEASLPEFAHEAERRGGRFVIHEDRSLALDLDEPSDLAAGKQLEPAS